MTDDDLIELAKKATPGPWVIIPPTPHEDEEGCFTHPGGIEGSDGNPVCVFGDPSGSGTMFENEVNPSYIAAANPAAIIALIERHRAEVAALEKWRDDALETFYNICVKALGWTDPRTHHSDIPPPEWTQGKISDGVKAEMDKLRAEVERLTRENNNLSAGQKHALESCWAAESALADMTRERDHWRAQCERCADDNVRISRLRNEAESALAAERKRCGELESLLRRCADELQAEINARYMGLLKYPSNQRKYKLDMEAVNNARAALAGKDARESGEQEEVK